MERIERVEGTISPMFVIKRAVADKLSQVPSEMILQALEDLEKIEKTPGYKIDMGNWHGKYTSDKLCHVCLAGVVIANRFGAHIEDNVTPGQIATRNGEIVEDKTIGKRLDALDSLRSGDFTSFLYLCGLSEDEVENLGSSLRELSYISHHTMGDWTHYNENADKFKANLRSVSEFLEEGGY